MIKFPVRDADGKVSGLGAIEHLHEEFKRQIKTQCVLPTAEVAAMLYWTLLVCGRISLRRVDGWNTLHVEPDQEPLDLAA